MTSRRKKQLSRPEREFIVPYKEACKVLLPKLREMSPVFAPFTDEILRTLLQSRAMARQCFAKLEEKGFFLGLIDKLEAITKATGGNTEIYQRWRDNRDTEPEFNVDDLKLEDLKI